MGLEKDLIEGGGLNTSNILPPPNTNYSNSDKKSLDAGGFASSLIIAGTGMALFMHDDASKYMSVVLMAVGMGALYLNK